MSRGVQGAVLRLLGAKDHRVEVVEAERLAPTLMRIRFSSSTLLDAVELAPTAWVRFWFPDPDGGGQEYQRAYSLLDPDRGTGLFDVVFVLHGDRGPASAWALAAAPGDALQAQVMGSSSFVLDAASTGLVALGDPSSLPAIASIVASLPRDRDVRLLLEDCDEEMMRVLGIEHPRLSVVHARRAGSGSLIDALRSSGFELDGRQLWAAGESASLKPVRKPLREREGAARGNTHVLAYWIEGRAMGNARRV